MKSCTPIWRENRKVSVFVIAVILALFALLGLLYGCRKNPENARNESNGNFRIRIKEESVFFMQFRYDFQTASEESGEWTTIESRTQDDPYPLSDIPVGFIGEKTGYYAFGKVFAMTTDEGATWNFFDYVVETDWGNRSGYVSRIASVEMDEDGRGTMRLKKLKNSDDPPVFETEDFGKTWK